MTEDKDQKSFPMAAVIGSIVTVVTVLVAIGYEVREMTNQAIQSVDARYDDLSAQHTRTFEAVLALYGDLDDRVDRIENHLMMKNEE